MAIAPAAAGPGGAATSARSAVGHAPPPPPAAASPVNITLCVFKQSSINYTEIILVDALCPVQFWSAQCVKRPIVTRAHVPRPASSFAVGGAECYIGSHDMYTEFDCTGDGNSADDHDTSFVRTRRHRHRLHVHQLERRPAHLPATATAPTTTTPASSGPTAPPSTTPTTEGRTASWPRSWANFSPL